MFWGWLSAVPFLRRSMKNGKESYEDKMNRLNSIIEECEGLRGEWEQRIKEVNSLKETYETLISIMRKQLNDGDTE